MKDKNRVTKVGGGYAHYVLIVLVIVYVFNFIDRNILSILSEEIQADLGVTDAQMGFLYGTVFAVFYAVFGIPLARFAAVAACSLARHRLTLPSRTVRYVRFTRCSLGSPR